MKWSWLRGLALLRHPELVRGLGRQFAKLKELEVVREDFPQSKISDHLVLVGYRSDRLHLEPFSAVMQGSVLAFGDQVNGFGSIQIGQRSWIGEYNSLRACGGGNIEIGADCLISQFCSLIGGNHAAAASRPIAQQGIDPARVGVTLHDDVWLGAGTTILPGVVIGRGAIVGANSVVNCHIPEYEIWAGSPARRIGSRLENQSPHGTA